MSQDKTEHALIYCYNMPYRSFTIYDHAYAFVYVYFNQTLVIAEADDIHQSTYCIKLF